MMRQRLTIAWMLFAISALYGCSTSQTNVLNAQQMSDYNGESVVVLARSYHTGNQTEGNFTECIVNALGNGRNGINVMQSSQFIDALFPWFEPRTAPNDIGDMPDLLANDSVARRIRETGVRYVVWLDGNTERPGGGGSLSCAAGPGGAGCFGFAWWENDSDYDAAVWDLEGQKQAGSIETRVNGTSYLPAIVVPIPLIARTRATACKDLAAQLRDFIGNTGGA